MTPPPDDALPLVHQGDAFLVLDKPSGLLSVPGRGPDKADCLATRVQRRFPEARVVHRLDMATSGLIVMALGLDAQRRLNQAFAERQVHKQYLAVVDGVPAAPAAQVDAEGWQVIDQPIAIDWPRRPLHIVDAAHGKPSVTRWRRLDRGDAADARLLLEPVTGRSHQLRVHLQAIGHPILGDTLYGDARVQARAPRLLLHACRLTLPHPVSGAPCHFESAAPF